ncbi:MAG: hypothetical protein HC769_17865 [Cyanobacteria bacterium CRU_2_1]|nr:hypothetical protein [Cyanobacteria bacterium CRU_2_1]
MRPLEKPTPIFSEIPNLDELDELDELNAEETVAPTDVSSAATTVTDGVNPIPAAKLGVAKAKTSAMPPPKESENGLFIPILFAALAIILLLPSLSITPEIAHSPHSDPEATSSPASGSTTQPLPQPASPSPPSTPPLSATFSPASNPFRDAVNRANEATRLNETATTAEDWAKVASLWQEAASLMQQVSTKDPNYAIAQDRVGVYGKNRSYAQKRQQGALE